MPTKRKLNQKSVNLKKKKKKQEGLIEDLILQKEKKYFFAVGKRKTAVAKVWLNFSRRNRGLFFINHKKMQEYFPYLSWQYKALEALKVVGQHKRFDIEAKIKGGGGNAQAEALRHGIAKALFKFNPDFRKKLKRAGLLMRDARIKERKKYGLKRARRAPQFSKR